jgi:hypothetical protein
MKLVFGDIVVVEDNLIGVVVKNWARASNGGDPAADVYVRNFNMIKSYPHSEVERYQVRHKYINDEEIEYQKYAEAEE